jgi:hypothetical protein
VYILYFFLFGLFVDWDGLLRHVWRFVSHRSPPPAPGLRIIWGLPLRPSGSHCEGGLCRHGRLWLCEGHGLRGGSRLCKISPWPRFDHEESLLMRSRPSWCNVQGASEVLVPLAALLDLVFILPGRVSQQVSRVAWLSQLLWSCPDCCSSQRINPC